MMTLIATDAAMGPNKQCTHNPHLPLLPPPTGLRGIHEASRIPPVNPLCQCGSWNSRRPQIRTRMDGRGIFSAPHPWPQPPVVGTRPAVSSKFRSTTMLRSHKATVIGRTWPTVAMPWILASLFRREPLETRIPFTFFLSFLLTERTR